MGFAVLLEFVWAAAVKFQLGQDNRWQIGPRPMSNKTTSSCFRIEETRRRHTHTRTHKNENGGSVIGSGCLSESVLSTCGATQGWISITA